MPGGTTPRGFSAHRSHSELPLAPRTLPGTLPEGRGDYAPGAALTAPAFPAARQDPRAELEVKTRHDEKDDPPNTDRRRP